MTILQPLGSFSDVEVLVIGDAMLDSYLLGSTDRLCQEAPVPIVAVDERETAAGGAANVAVNVRALGGRATLVSAWSGKCSVMNTSPGRRPRSMRTGVWSDPRLELTRTTSPSTTPSRSASSGDTSIDSPRRSGDV